MTTCLSDDKCLLLKDAMKFKPGFYILVAWWQVCRADSPDETWFVFRADKSSLSKKKKVAEPISINMVEDG